MSITNPEHHRPVHSIITQEEAYEQESVRIFLDTRDHWLWQGALGEDAHTNAVNAFHAYRASVGLPVVTVAAYEIPATEKNDDGSDQVVVGVGVGSGESMEKQDAGDLPVV